MISDFSAIVYDYIFLRDKPLIYATSEFDMDPYDGADIPDDVDIWQFSTLEKIGIKLNKEDFKNIKEIIQNASDSPELANARKIAKEQAWQHINEAGKRTVDYMISVMENK